MKKLQKKSAILIITALVFVCVSTQPSFGAEQKPTEAPSGSIHFEETQVMAILGGDWGHGTLGYQGKTYKFKLTGMGAGGVGIHKISATGNVYYLKDIADFPGKYSELRAGITVGEGAGGYYIRNDNDKGVVIELRTHAEGVALSIGVQGLTIQMVDEK
jgi:hypothetical protein